MASTSLTFDLLARDRASDKFDRVGSAASRAGGHLSGLGSKFKSMAKYGALAAGAAAVFAAKAGWDAVQAASDLNETVNKSRVIFGKGSKAMEDFADTAATKMGLSKQAALDAASTFGVFGKSAGLSGDHLTRFAGGLTTLSQDMASFNNTSPQEAIEAIGSALRGESEPIRKYGILLNDATLKARAMKMGLIETTTQALTPQQKVLASQAEIYAQAGDQMGDFNRTSGGLANQQKILAAEFDNVKAKLGAQLLPIAVKVANWLTSSFIPAAAKVWSFLKEKLGPVFAEVGDFVRDRLLPALSDFKDDVGPGVSDAMSAVKGAFKDAKPFLQDVGNFVIDTLIPVMGDLARNVLPLVAGHIRRVGKAFAVMGNVIKWTWNNVIQPQMKFFVLAIAALLDTWGTLMDALSHVKGFGWAKDAADKLHHAADEARGFANELKKIPPSVSTTVITTYVSRGGPGGQAGGSGSITGGGSGGGTDTPPRKTGGGRRGKSGWDGVEIHVVGIQDPAAKAFIHTGGSSRY